MSDFVPVSANSPPSPPLPPSSAGIPKMPKGERVYRWIEYTALFFVVPTIFSFRTVDVPLAVLLYSAFVLCLAMLLRDESFDRDNLWRPRAVWRGRGVARVLGLCVVGAVVIGAIVKVFAPERYLSFPVRNPWGWMAVMFLYPVLSVWPQQVIYRSFIFHRYEALFPTRWGIIWASALAFCWGHVIFHNWIALALTLAGGLIFASTYHRYRSGFLVSIEHAIYGCLVFSLGLGESLYYAAVRR